MADGTTLNTGSGGDTIYTEDLSNGTKMGASKIHNGAHGADGGAITAANPFNIDIATVGQATVAKGHGTAAAALRVELPTDGTGVVGLIAGTAIVGKVTTDQTTHGTTDLVAADITKVGGSALALGNAALAASIPTLPANAAISLKASSTDAVAHTVTGSGVTGLGGYKTLDIILSVTAAAAAVGDTLDVYIDSSVDGGTTWTNAVHYPQVLGNGGAKQFAAVLSANGANGATCTDTSADAAANVVRPGLLADDLRVRYTIADGGAHGQSFTFAVLAYGKG